MRAPPPVQKDGPRINEEIRTREVQLIDQTGHNHGPVDTQIALEKGPGGRTRSRRDCPNSVPPVCKLLDYGKYKYQAQKKAAEARKKQKVVEVKEIKLRPMIDDHDYDVKMRSMKRFFEEGDKVKVTLRFRGREMAHQELGYKLLNRVKDDIAKIAKVEQDARFEGRQVVMMLAPAGRVLGRYRSACARPATTDLCPQRPMGVVGTAAGRPPETHAWPARSGLGAPDCHLPGASAITPASSPPGRKGCRGGGEVLNQHAHFEQT